MSVEELVLIGGPDDGVITPWQSRSLVVFLSIIIFIHDYFLIMLCHFPTVTLVSTMINWMSNLISHKE